MNTLRLALPLLFAVVAAPSQAQQVSAMAVLLVQFGPGDLVLNKPLLDAIVNEPACTDAIRKSAGDKVDVVRVETDLPAPHAAGTFQVHFAITTRAAVPASEQATLVDPVVAHLRSRLDQLLFAQPQEQAQTRGAELTRRLEELLLRRATLHAKIESAATASADVAQRRAAYDQQIAAVRLDVATQERAREQVDKLRAQYSEIREQRRAEVTKLLAEKAMLEQGLDEMSAAARGPDRDKPDVAALLRAKANAFNASVRALTARLETANTEATDAQRMLTVVLEQLPTGALDQQRAQARIDALAESRQQLDELATAAAKERDANVQREIEAERLAIELAVTKTLLTEVAGKLARLQPVRYELLRSAH